MDYDPIPILKGVNMKKGEVFKNGSTWVRADFHLHTRSDKEFKYDGEDNQFISDYIHALKTANIHVGVITNHNKFNQDEFKALRKKGRNEDIFILPGVELSINDGENGIHTLIVFSEDWIGNGNDYINQFLNVVFAGKVADEYQCENARSNYNLLETIKRLEEFHRDFFLVFAHVEQRSGLWKELGGSRIIDLGVNEAFIRRTAAFQKVRTHKVEHRGCRSSVKSWLKDWYPAEVEGSDCKSINEVARGEPCYLKIGEFTFEAVKYALLDHNNRVSKEILQNNHSHISEISFEGGVLDGKTISFSPELNCLIGIRGSGKSSILEALRYVTDIPFGDKALDKEYKNGLVRHTLGSGGKIIIRAKDRRGQEYEIRRILNERPDVYVNNNLKPGISIRETIIYKPIYFGQKDLSSTGDGFEKDLVEKLLGEKLDGIRERIEIQRQIVSEALEQLKKLSNVEEKKEEWKEKKQDAEFKLNFYKKHGVEEKLQKQVDFETDSRKSEQITSFVQRYLIDLNEFVSRYEDELKNYRLYKSEQNEDFFRDFFNLYDTVLRTFEILKTSLNDGKVGLARLNEKRLAFEQTKQGLKEEFAEIERKIAEELKAQGVSAIFPNEFLQLRKTVDQAQQMLELLNKQHDRRDEVYKTLQIELSKLNDLWHEEFRFIQSALSRINDKQAALQIRVEFKGDKETYVNFLKEVFRGSRIRDPIFKNIIDHFVDISSIFKDMDAVKSLIGNSATVFEEYFNNNLQSLLTWQVPNRFIIEYRGKDLKHHSLGQRASALILFVLSQRDNDIIIIDQPEDDLDNQTIYEDVIKLIRDLKQDTQFILATHNANFPVLGDAEQIVACRYSDEKIEIDEGSIDCPELQNAIIGIMEGGLEAFAKRKEIYQIWKPQNSLKK
jgi:ABC-type cobalamin/Fe3+-siderophores transport system ATPase subunit